MSTMCISDDARPFDWELETLRNSRALTVSIELLLHIDVPSFVHIAVLWVSDWISNAAALEQKLRPLWEVRPLFNSWCVMACFTGFTCFYLCCLRICVVDFLVESFFTELAGVSFVSMLASAASFAADLCFHWTLEFPCLWMCSRANLWLNWFYLLNSMICGITFSEFNMIVIEQARRSVNARSFSNTTRWWIFTSWTCFAHILASLSEFVMVPWTQKALTLFFIWHTSSACLAFFVHGLGSNHFYPSDFSCKVITYVFDVYLFVFPFENVESSWDSFGEFEPDVRSERTLRNFLVLTVNLKAENGV